MIVAIILIELVVMFWLRKEFVRHFISFVVKCGGSIDSGIWWYAILSLPGVLCHEIAHFLMAALLGLRTGAIELLPKLTDGGGVEFGSVQVEKSDPLRLSLVGLAPVVLGLPIVAWLSILMKQAILTNQIWQIVAFGYVLTTITIHLLPSKKDMATWLITIIIGGLISLLLIEANKILEIKWSGIKGLADSNMLSAIAESLMIPLGGLIVGWGVFFLINSIMRKR